MTVLLALIAILVPASVTAAGLLFKQQADNRLSEEHQQSEKRLEQEQKQEEHRLKLDAAMRAADLFTPSGCAVSNAARCASGLLALARLGFADLAVAQLVDLWSPQPGPLPSAAAEPKGSCGVSTETAIQVINVALETCEPDAQLMAAELLCRNACRLDIRNSLHWPSSVNSAWIPGLPVTAKLLIVDALVHMALASEQTGNALRELAVRLYGVSAGDPEPRVQGCIGTLMEAVLPAVRNLGYTDFMKGPEYGFVTLEQMERAAAKATRHPDGYFEAIVEDRSEKLKMWSQKCTAVSFAPGSIAPAGCGLKEMHADGKGISRSITPSYRAGQAAEIAESHRPAA